MTELAARLAEFMLGPRIDSHRHVWFHGAAQRGPPVGCASRYFGYEEGGQLTEAVRRKSYSGFCWTRSRRRIRGLQHLLQILDEGA